MKGTIVIAITPSGDVAATAADFEGGGAAGFSRKDNQERRAMDVLYHEIIDSYCSHVIAPAVKKVYRHDMIRNLREAGWKFESRQIDTEKPIEDEDD